MTIEKGPEREPEALGSAETDEDSPEEQRANKLFNMGCVVHNRGGIEEAVKLWEKSAELGNASAYFALSAVVKERGDMEKAIELLGGAAERGHKRAIIILKNLSQSNNS